MSDSPKTPDDHRDRLVDRVLAEALGGERPPDLSPIILDRLEEQKVNVATVRQTKGSLLSWRSGALLVTTAASLLIGVLVLPRGVQNEREVAIVVVDQTPELPTDKKLAFEPTATGVATEVPTVTVLDGLDAQAVVPSVELAKPSPAASEFGYSVGRGQGLSYSDAELRRAPAQASEKRVPSVAPASASNAGGVYAGTGVRADEEGDGFAGMAAGVPGATHATGDYSKYGGELGENSWQSLSRRGGFSEGRDFYRNPGYGQEPPTADRYAPLQENPFTKPLGEDALSTFSIDVDTASYSNVRQYLVEMRQAPPAGAVRVEELVNYFDYDYAPPAAGSEAPFAAAMAVAPCPWAPSHRLVRIGVKGREVAVDKRPLSNLVFLVDVSGSMNEPNKLPLVVEGLKALTEKLGENDRVAIAVYAGSEGLVLPSTTGDQKDAIRSALSRLTAGGSTAGGAGLRLAYEVAERHKIVGGVNRVVLCTDGDFNVGMTGTEELAKFVETRAKETGVYLTVLGFGRGNLNDAMLEQISGRGDGHYAYIDNEREARRVLSQDLSGTLVTIAKDVKLQVEFNPAKVASYRLVGYENRILAAEDFNNDAKDAGDIGAGHTVTALYEIVPVGVEPAAPPVDGLKYQSAAVEDDAARAKPTADSRQPIAPSPELLTLKIRYKQPEGGASTKLEFPLVDTDKTIDQADADFRWAAAVAEFGMLLRGSQFVGDATFETVLERARGAIGEDLGGYRAEFLDLVRRAKELSGR